VLLVVPVRVRLPGQESPLVGVPDGRPVGDAGTDGQDRLLLLRVQVGIALDFRPGTHQAHITGQDIDQLGKLVQFELAQTAPHPRDPGIVVGGGGGAHLLGVDDHGPELENAEGTSVPPCPLAPVEDGSSVLPPDRQGDPGQNGAQEDQAAKRHQEIEEALHCFAASFISS
jgi:hypothetical protein